MVSNDQTKTDKQKVTTAAAAATSTASDAIELIFHDGLMPTKCLVKLKTQTPIVGTKPRPLFAISGIDGFSTTFKPLAAKLSVPFYGLQASAEVPLTSIPDLAEFYIKQIKSVQETGPYIIIGYSFGAAVAFEMATLLENAGEKATLVLVDGSPEYVRWNINGYLQSLKDVIGADGDAYSLESTAILLAFYKFIFVQYDYVKMAHELVEFVSFDAKLKHITELIAHKTNFPLDTVELAALSYYKKTKASTNYKPNRKLTATNVILFRTNDDHEKLSDDYGLSEVNFLMN